MNDTAVVGLLAIVGCAQEPPRHPWNMARAATVRRRSSQHANRLRNFTGDGNDLRQARSSTRPVGLTGRAASSMPTGADCPCRPRWELRRHPVTPGTPGPAAPGAGESCGSTARRTRRPLPPAPPPRRATPDRARFSARARVTICVCEKNASARDFLHYQFTSLKAVIWFAGQRERRSHGRQSVREISGNPAASAA